MSAAASGPARPNGTLLAALRARLVADLPGLVVAEPTAVDAALDVCVGLLGHTLHLARLTMDTDAYIEIVVGSVMRADRLACAHAVATIDATVAASASKAARQ